MAKEVKVENGKLVVTWMDGSVDTWTPDTDVDLNDYKQIGGEVRRYVGLD